MGLMNIELLVVPGCRNERTGGNFVAITAKAAWEDVARSRFRCRDSRGVVLTSGAVHYCGPGYMHSVLRAVRPTPHPHLAVRNAALRGAAFSVAGLAVEASRAFTGWLPRSACWVAQGT